MAGIDMLAGVTVAWTDSNDLSYMEPANEPAGLYDSDAEALIRLIDGRNAVRLCKKNTMARDNSDESSAQIESTVAESVSRGHGLNTRSKARDKRHKSLMVSSNVATSTGSSSSGAETGPQAKQPQLVGGNQTFNKVTEARKEKMNTGQGRRRSIRSMLEEDDSESEEEDNDSRPAKRQQFTAGCSIKRK